MTQTLDVICPHHGSASADEDGSARVDESNKSLDVYGRSCSCGRQNYHQAMSLEFLNSLSIRAEISLSQPAQRIAPTWLNLMAPPGATLESLELEVSVCEMDGGSGQFRAPTDEEFARIVVESATLRMQSVSDDCEKIIEHSAPNGRFFTVWDMLVAIEETERQTRGGSAWFGGIDVHHIFCEGISLEGDVWSIGWGS